MKILLRGLRHFFVSLVTGSLVSKLLLHFDELCHGDPENAAGGGAALGMVMLAFLGGALLSEFAILVSIDLARHAGLVTWRPTWRIDLLSMIFVVAISAGVAYQFVQGTC